jgi:tetratricopeptide (TPR) repeat protein
MFASRLVALCCSPPRYLWRVMGRFPKSAVLVALGFLGLIGAGYLWLLPEYHYRAALSACKEDRLLDARRHLDWCFLVRPNDYEAHLLAARTYRMNNDVHKAESHLDECKRIRGQATSSVQLEWLLLRAQISDLNALEPGLVTMVKAQDPDSPWILESLAHCYLTRLSFHIAHTYIDQWLKLEPDNLRALNWRGVIRERVEYVEGAHDDCVRILEISPGHWAVRVRLVGYLLQGLKLDEAETHLQILLKEHGDDAEVLAHWGQFNAFKGEMEHAKKIFDDLLAKNPDDARALYQRGKLELQEGRPEKAAQMIRRTLELDKGNVEARYSLYTALERIPGRKQEAKAALAEFQKGQQDNKKLKLMLEKMERFTSTQSLVEAAEIFLREGQTDLARLFLIRAVGMDSANKRAHELLVNCYEELVRKAKTPAEQKQAAESLEHWRKALERISAQSP